MHKEVQYCTCVKEKHQNGGLHYHVALKLPGPKHCKSLKESISLKEWIVVNFSGNSDNYYSAYRYICKDDDSVHHSEHHLNLDEVASSGRKSSTHTYREAGKPYCPGEPNRCFPKTKVESNNQEMSDSIRSHWVFIELFYDVNKREEKEQTDLVAFLLSKSSKSFNNLIKNTWKINKAKSFIERQKATKMQILRKWQSENCVNGWNIEWYDCAREVLQLNIMNPFVFADAMRDLPEHRRGKFRNVVIVGPANCGKTFLLKTP